MDAAPVIVFVVCYGKVVEGREYFDDTAKADEFFRRKTSEDDPLEPREELGPHQGVPLASRRRRP